MTITAKSSTIAPKTEGHTVMTVSGELREAATTIEDRAEPAARWSPPPWAAEKVYDESYTVVPVGVMDSDYEPNREDRTGDHFCRVHSEEASYIALMDPAAGLAVAAWLRDYASFLDVFESGGFARTEDNCPALRLARRITSPDSSDE